MMKDTKIEKLDNRYLLVVHPMPIIEGEMLVFQPRKADQDVKDLITYRDYSLRKRMPMKEQTKKISDFDDSRKKKKEKE